jgi:hypothetical protein
MNERLFTSFRKIMDHAIAIVDELMGWLLQVRVTPSVKHKN